MRHFKEIYDANELFYWCNSLGEINMPGDGKKCIPHHLEELPLAVRDAYEKYWSEGTIANRYIVSFKGKVGVLLTALYDESYVEDATDMDENTHEFSIMMSKIFDYLCGKASALEFFINEADCIAFVGDYSDPGGLELALFVPAANDESTVEKCIELFEANIYTDEDFDFMRKAAERLK